jgi:cation diffusion facilitator family transporter
VSDTASRLASGLRAARLSVLANAALAVIKGVAGIVGHSFALVADAIESLADILGSAVVWSGLRISAQDADADHPYGHGKAEPLAAAAVGVLLLAAALAIAVQGVRGVRAPGASPEGWTLAIIAGVILAKEMLFRRVIRVSDALGSTAVMADAWHHRSDALSSLAAFVGIGLAVLGGDAWAWADDGAALVAAVIIAVNGWRIVRPAVHELMDGAPDQELVRRVREAAEAVPGVRRTEKLLARKVGTRFLVDLHVHADPSLTLHDAHHLGGIVKTAICHAIPSVENVLVHMEPDESLAPKAGRSP